MEVMRVVGRDGGGREVFVYGSAAAMRDAQSFMRAHDYPKVGGAHSFDEFDADESAGPSESTYVADRKYGEWQWSNGEFSIGEIRDYFA